jgi:hypothetical protein
MSQRSCVGGRRGIALVISAVFSGVSLVDVRVADACGCLSPPAVTEGDFAVNQRAEQIIFEVEPGWVTAHVLIKYAGAPEKFAWLIPAPEAPELAISPVSAFGLLDQATAPAVSVNVRNLCPTSAWTCKYHDLSCGKADYDDSPSGASDAGANDGANTPPVMVLDEQVIGDYQTVTFRASEAAAATKWLIDNGFIVNPTTSIYMEPYIQANMVFVAAKLVPGAGVSSIKPLRMRYRAAFPMIPLVLTAVAAEPHLTVTSYVYSDQPFRPMGHPVVTISGERIARDRTGRLNYPMVLARAVDEAGGDGFVVEYRGQPVVPQFGMQGFCCGSDTDFCGLGGNGSCECPGDAFDRADCAAQGDLLDGIALLEAISQRHTRLTRITTRVSAEEMTFDPTFEPDYGATLSGRLVLAGEQPSLAACASQVIDQARYAELDELQSCAAIYCGSGQCVTTAAGAACACDAGFVAQRFLDLDDQPSVTCVPRIPPVDLRAGGLALPDACAGVDCGMGACRDRNGVAVCECDGGAGAVPTAGTTPRCEPIERLSQTPGGQDFSEPLRTLEVCAPPPPTCGENGWLVRTTPNIPGVSCGKDYTPSARLTTPRPAPDCGFMGCGGCQQAAPTTPLALFALAGGTLALLTFRRRSNRSRGQA